MKFYHFEEARFDYDAIIWAENKQEALKKYREDVCDVIPREHYRPRKIDVDIVFQMMVDIERDDDREVRAHGEIGELYKIITSKEPIVVLHNCQ